MKVFLKVIGVIFLLIIVAIISIPLLLEKNIDTFVRKTISQQVNADVDYSNIELSLIKNFPKASLNIHDLLIINREPFKGDTLVNTKEISTAISFTQLFKGFENGIEIDKIYIENADINVLINKEGKANYDISIASEDNSKDASSNSESSNFKLNLNYEIKDSNIKYTDESSKIKLALLNLSHSGKGDISSSLTDLTTKTFTDLSFEMNGLSYAKQMPIDLEAILGLDLENNKYTFKENTALINHIPLTFSGFVALLNKKDTDIELEFVTKDADFKNLLSAIPNAYKKNINGVSASGKFDLHGSIKGITNDKQIPNLDISLLTQNSSFKYPDLPKGIKNITIDAKVTNSTGITDDTQIDFNTFKMKIDEDEFTANGHLKNLTSNLLADLTAKGTLNLANLNQAYPVNLDTKLSGIINADVETKFSINDIEKENYTNIKKEGVVSLKDFLFSSDELPNPVNISSAKIDFNKNRVDLKEFNMTSGKSDLQATGSIENIIPFVFSNKVLKGSFDLISNQFIVSDFLSTEETTTETNSENGETTTEGLIPSFLDITSNFSANKVEYDNLKLTNTKGNLTIKDKKAILKNVTTQIFGGTIALNGAINSKEKTPSFKMDLDMQKLNIGQSFLGFESFQKMAPIASALEGLFSTKLSLNGNLNNDLTPNLSSLKGNALANLINAKMNPEKNKLVNSLNQKTGFVNLDKLNLKDLTTKLNFEDGKIKVAPFNLKISDDINATLSGGHAFDGGLDYNLNLDLPAKYLGSQTSGLLSKLSNQEQNQLNVPLPITLGGTLTSPKIGLDMKGAVSNLSQQIITSQKAKATQKVKKEASKLVEKQLSGKAKDLLGGIIGGDKKKDSTQQNKANNSQKTEDVIKKKAGKLLEGLFK